jgi:pimeloyl-ACP methyl ester carboxylesterase
VGPRPHRTCLDRADEAPRIHKIRGAGWSLSGVRLYWEKKGLSFFDVKGVAVPVAVSVFPDELYPAPRSWAERAYPKLIHYNKVEKGGHFAAWEQPQLFSEEVRAGFRPLRSGVAKSDAMLASAG